MDRVWAAWTASEKFLHQHKPPQGSSPSVHQSFRESRRHLYDALIYETHFYFIAWFNCAEMLERLTKDSAFREARKAYSKNAKLFDHYKAGRHSFEHFSDRLPGGKESRKINLSNEDSHGYTGFGDGFYRHGGLEWDITHASLEKLNTAVDAVLTVMHFLIDKRVAEKLLSHSRKEVDKGDSEVLGR